MKLNRILRPRSIRTKQRLLNSASSARPASIEPLENRQMLSVTVDVRSSSGGKSVTATSVGQVINLQIWATVTGNMSGTTDGLVSICGSLLSSETSQADSVAGNLQTNMNFLYTAQGASNGTQQDLNGDGNLDIGSNNNGDIAGFFNARAGYLMQNGTVSGDSQSFEIATLTYTVTNLHYGSETDVNFRFRDGVPAGAYDAVWQQDGIAYNDQNGPPAGAYALAGAPLVITDPNLSPPSGSISGTVNQSVGGTTSALAGTTVYLDTNDDGVLDSGDISTTTASSGSYSFTGLGQGTYLLREVVPSGYTQTSPANTPTLLTLSSNSDSITGQNFVDTAARSPLNGTVIGTSGSYNNDGNTIAKAFDGSLSTFYDGATANGNWAGLNLGSGYTINSISYSPRSGWAGRMVGGVFQGSNSPTFASGVTTLATITSTPGTGSYTSVNVTNTASFEYVRYLSPSGSYGDVAELQFYGSPSQTPPTAPQVTGTVIGTSGSYQNDGNTIAKAFDGSVSTFYDGATANGNWAGLNLGAEYAISSISYAPRASWASRMVGGIFQGSNDPNFVSGVVNLATVTSTPATGSYTTLNVANTSAFQYVRYLSPNGSYGDVADIKFYGTYVKAAPSNPQLTGTVIGTSGSYLNGGNTIAKAFDGNLSTFFDGPTANGNWAGLDLGSAQTIAQISYAPRSGWASRMVGGIFQASNSATFSSGVVNLYTITSTPATGTLTTVNVSASGTYRYVRYLSPAGSYGDVAEIQFFG